MKPTISRLLVGLLSATLAVGAFAQDKAAAKPGVVATVNGQAIPQARFDVFLADQKSRGAPDNAEVRAAIREELVRREVIAQAAKKKGVDKKPGFSTKLEMLQQTALLSAYIEEFVKTNPVTDADVRKAYNDIAAKSAKKEYKARHILFGKDDEAKAKAAITKLKGGAKFADLAKDSIDPGSKDNGGDLGWNTPDAYVPAFSEAMAKLEKGKFTTEPVKSDFGWHVILLEDVRDATPPPFEQVKPQLQQRLQQQKVEQHVAELMKAAKVQ